jgi:hypothetical protein
VASDVYAWVGCISGAEQRQAYFGMIAEAGLGQVEVLRDTDYVATLAASAPDELAALLDRAGVEQAAVLGKIRSVTFRARKA